MGNYAAIVEPSPYKTLMGSGAGGKSSLSFAGAMVPDLTPLAKMAFQNRKERKRA